MDFEDDNDGQTDITTSPVASDDEGTSTKSPEELQAERANVKRILETIKADKKYFEAAFTRMRRDMRVTMYGAEESWDESNYRANVVGRHVKQKTASLYAKNPKAVAIRREQLDFRLWDESEQSIMLAFQMVQNAAMQAQQFAAMGPVIDQATGMPAEPPPPPPGFQEAQELIADFQQGMQRRMEIKKLGKTLEILFSRALGEQKPLDFKMSMKQLVRRACTTGVGYVEIGFQREMGPRSDIGERLADFQARLAHLERLKHELMEGEIEETDAEMDELRAGIAALQSEPEIIVREGPIFDFLPSTKVIPDKRTTSLSGFVGAGHLSIERLYTRDEIEEVFGVDVGGKYTPYTMKGTRGNGVNMVEDDDQRDMFPTGKDEKKDLICVFKHYDKASGLVYYVADGYDRYLREPAAPDVFVTDFWPVYALTFNAVENENELFPLSDASLLIDMQREYNRNRQGKREHRKAARPRYAYANGAFDKEDVEQLKNVEPFEAIGLNIDPQTKLSEVLQVIPVPGVDPNLYDNGEVWQDMQVVAGAQQAELGGMSRGTATEASISANSTASSDGSSVDDLDAFLSMIARATGQILMKEMSAEQVVAIVGPGAVWPTQSLAQIADEIYLEVQAGSSGKPNQAVEVANWQKMLPFLIQMPGINPTWLARESIRRLDDKLDLTEAIAEGMSSIVAQNSQSQPALGGPEGDPNAQGAEGANNGPKAPGGPAGTDAPMGDNNPEPGVIRYDPAGKRVGA
jgi:hypothetical protein